CAIDAQQAGQGIRSKVTTEQMVLLVLIGILVVTIIALAASNLCSDLFEGETFLKCEAGWEKHGGNCYYFNINKSSWTDSRRSCADLGSDLVKIDSREECFWRREFWIGLTDSMEEGKWFWVDGSPLHKSLSFWNQSQPDNRTKVEADCVRMGKKGKPDNLKSWFDTSCNYPQKSICEKTAGLSSCVSEV
uniref:C-type lectin domain-containing protein n=1 Tax=Xiphophorus maculatus TaxID=8083 RepID=A0A3B5Q1R7_XIPMA